MVAVLQRSEVVAQVEEILAEAVGTPTVDGVLPGVATSARAMCAWARQTSERLGRLGTPAGRLAERLDQLRADAAALDQVAEGIAISAEAIAAIATPTREDAARKLAALAGPLAGLRGAMILIERLAGATALEAEVRAQHDQVFAGAVANADQMAGDAADDESADESAVQGWDELAARLDG